MIDEVDSPDFRQRRIRDSDAMSNAVIMRKSYLGL